MLPSQMSGEVIAHSVKLDTYKQEEAEYTDDDEGFDFKKWVVFEEDHWFVFTVTSLNAILCLISTYFYLWVACFDNDNYYLMIGFESFFVMSMAFNFIIAFTPDGETQPNKNLAQISKRYLANGFVKDLIPLLPVPFLFDHNSNFHHVSFLLKIIRIEKGFACFNVGSMMDAFKGRIKERTDKKIESDPLIGEDKINDHNNIEFIMITGYIFATLKLVIIILNCSYFLGLGF